MEQLQNFDLLPTSAFGACLLRFVLAGFWIAHWWFKVGYRGMPATEAFFKEQGLPTWLAWFDIRFEVVIAAGLILGIYVPLRCLISLTGRVAVSPAVEESASPGLPCDASPAVSARANTGATGIEPVSLLIRT